MVPALIISAFNLILYFTTIFYGYVMDDTNRIDYVKAGGFKNWRSWKRPIGTIRDYLYGAGTFGTNKKVDHIFTLSLWTTLCILVYFAFGHNTISLAAALLVSCHPLMNQLSIWLNGRRYLVGAIMLMLCMVTWPWSMPFYLFAGIMQVTVLFAPIIFFMKAPLVIVAIGIMAAIMWPWINRKINERAAMIPCDHLKKWYPGRPVLIVKLYGFYFFKMIVPQRVQMVYPFLQMFGRTKEGTENGYAINRDFIKGVLSLFVTAVIFYFVPVYFKPYLVFMFCALVQWCGVIPVTQLVADRYAAVSTIFICFFISYFAFTYFPFTAAVGVLAVLAGGYIYATVQSFEMYKDIVRWYDYHVYNDFGNIGVVTLKIGLLLAEKRLWQAQAMIERALFYYPNDYALHYLGYICCMIVGAIPLAKAHMDVCRNNIYLGEEETRKGEIEDADLGLRAMMGEQNLKIPPHMMAKRGTK